MIDVFASVPWYVEHLAPVWCALPPEARGLFHVSARSAPAASGLPNVTTRPMAHDPRRPTLVVSYGDYRAVRMAGRAKVALGQHGAGQSYSGTHHAYPGGRDQADVSLFLVPNETAAARWRAMYPKARVAVVGCPKLDTLPRKPRMEPPVVAFSFHWDGPVVAPELRSAWPLYRHVIARIAKRHQVIGHAHPKALNGILLRFYRDAGVPVVPSFAAVLRQADLYCADNSSSLFEFAATGRPVVVLNAPWYRRDVRHGLRFWDAAGVGINADGPAELDAVIDRALTDPPEVAAARERALSLVYQPRSGGAEMAASALLEWAGRPG